MINVPNSRLLLSCLGLLVSSKNRKGKRMCGLSQGRGRYWIMGRMVFKDEYDAAHKVCRAFDDALFAFDECCIDPEKMSEPLGVVS